MNDDVASRKIEIVILDAHRPLADLSLEELTATVYHLTDRLADVRQELVKRIAEFKI